jgi:dihydroorotate dehydrogenase
MLYRRLIRPLLFASDAEKVHHTIIGVLERFGPLLDTFSPVPSGPSRTVFGVSFPSIVGLAAGMDKNAVALPAWAALGFGFAEIGTVTAFPQPGNPSPRLFRYVSQEAIVNRMGFNNEGCEAVGTRLERLRDRGEWPSIPVGINLGKSKVTPLQEAAGDYLHSFRRLHALGDYFVVNVSSPNTPGLRTLQDSAALTEILKTLKTANLLGKPILIKIAPDLTDKALDEIVELAEREGAAGLIATNTTTDHSAIAGCAPQTGGLSGKPLRKRATEVIRHLCRLTKLPVIGVGGVSCVDSAMEKLDAGAALLQIYTGFVYEGPGLPRHLARHLRSALVNPSQE